MTATPSATPIDAVAARSAVPPVERADLSGSATARACALLATACLGTLLPVLMVIANKSAPAVFAAGAILANAAALLAGAAPILRRRYLALASGPPAILTWLVLALFIASFAWSIDPGYTRRGLIEGVPELLFALGAAAAWPLVGRRGDVIWLAAGIAAAGLLILFEREAGMPLHALARVRGEAWDLKRSAIPPVLLLWPAAAYYLAHRRFLVAAGLLLAAVVGVVASHSGSPGFALVAAVGVAALARLAPRTALGLVGVLALALIAAGPFTGTVANRFVTPEARQALREEHANHRILIWNAFEQRVADHIVLGHGFDTSYRVSVAPRPGGEPPGPDNAEMTDNHPHNSVLQVWVELGLLGALLAAICVASVLWRLAGLPADRMAPRLGLLACVIGVGLVGLSAWQPWWIASIAVAMLWFGRLAAEDGI